MRKLTVGVMPETMDELEQLLAPIMDGRVRVAAVDTETTPVLDDRFTSYASPTRIAGFSVSYDLGDKFVDFYAPVRHIPYDWRRRRDLIENDTKRDGPEWVERLLEVEHVRPPGFEGGDIAAFTGGYQPNLNVAGVRDVWQRMFAVPDVTWAAHNWPFDSKMFDVEGVTLPWQRMECTQSMSVFTDPRPLDKWDRTLRDGKGGYVHGGHALKHLGEVWLGIPADAQATLLQAQEVLGESGRKLMDYSMLPLITAIAPYGCMDTRLTLNLLYHMQEREGYQDEAVRALIDKHTLERKCFVDMERAGMPVDRLEAIKRAEQKQRDVDKLAARGRKLAGMDLAFSHGEKLAEQLYDQLGIPTYRGNKNTRKPTLKKVQAHLVGGQAIPSGITADDAVDLLGIILEWRTANKELTAFYRPLTYFGETGRIHTVLRPVEARTTRASAQKPNAMQMSKPKKGKTAKETRANQEASVRHLFKPDPGHVLLPLDYSQQELRAGAHYALAIPGAFDRRFTWRCTLAKRGDCKGRAPHGPKGDIEACKDVVHVGWKPNYEQKPVHMNLVEGFMSGDADFDPHQAMTEYAEAEGLGITRDEGKTANFAIMYGAGIAKISETLDCSWEVARSIFNIFWDKAYPELGYVKMFVEERLRRVGKPGKWSHQDYIRTMHGGRIYLDSGFKGLNYLIQRSCREILLNAIVAIDAWTRECAPTYRLVLPVHDELIFQVPKDDLDKAVVRKLCAIMVSAGSACRIPMVVEPNVCRVSWAIKEELGDGWGWDGVNEGVQPMEELLP